MNVQLFNTNPRQLNTLYVNLTETITKFLLVGYANFAKHGSVVAKPKHLKCLQQLKKSSVNSIPCEHMTMLRMIANMLHYLLCRKRIAGPANGSMSILECNKFRNVLHWDIKINKKNLYHCIVLQRCFIYAFICFSRDIFICYCCCILVEVYSTS